jgi:hypothetical protein
MAVSSGRAGLVSGAWHQETPTPTTTCSTGSAPDGPTEVSSPHVAGAVAGPGRAETARRHLDDAYDAAGQGDRAVVLRAEADTLASYL